MFIAIKTSCGKIRKYCYVFNKISYSFIRLQTCLTSPTSLTWFVHGFVRLGEDGNTLGLIVQIRLIAKLQSMSPMNGK